MLADRKRGDYMSKDNDKNLVKETAEKFCYTYGDYLKWDDEKRCELIDGRIYMMVPAPYRQHQKVSGELLRQIANYLIDKDCEVYAAPFDVRLPEGKEKDADIKTVVQPDIVVVCDKSKLDKLGCKGSPDLVIEVVSPHSGGKDRKIKRDLYEKHGIREYWLVDYSEKTVEVYLLNEDGTYGKSAVYLEDEDVSVSILKNLEIDLSYVFRA